MGMEMSIDAIFLRSKKKKIRLDPLNMSDFIILEWIPDVYFVKNYLISIQLGC